MKKFYSLIVLMISLVLPQSIMAADPDLSEFTLIKTLDFTTATYPSDQAITLSGTKSGITAYETGNKKQQDVFDVVTPEKLSGSIYFQGTGSKGWAIRSTKGGLWSYNANRSAAIPNLKKDYVVVFKCTDAASNVMTLTNGDGNPDGNFTYTTSEDGKSFYCTMTADGYVGFCGNKSKGYIESISIYAPGTVLIQPTAKYTAVNGKSRTVTFTGANLAYNTDGGDNYTATNANTWDATVSETTTYHVVSTKGDEKSEPLVFTIEAGTEISLADINVGLSAISEGFTKTYTLTCDNKDVLLNPTAKFTYDFVGTNGTTQNGVECNGTIEATEAGTYTITAAADGYVSTTATIDNTKEYELTKAIDFTALKATDLSSNWVLLNANTSVPGSSSQWQSKYSDVVTDEYYYNFSSETASATDVIPGLNIEFDETGKTPKLYTGFGFMYPVHVLGADGTEAASPAINDGKIAINEGTAEQFGVYTYINNYGKNGTKTTILTGDQPFVLYRFSDLLTKVEIYSPKTSSIPAAENIAALKALADGTEATLTLNKAKVLVSRGSMTGRTAVVEDESGVIAFGADLMGMLMEFEVTEGKAVTGKITGVYTVVNGIPTFAGSENTGSESAGDAVTAVEDFTIQPVTATIADAKKAENLLKVVTIKDLTLSYNNTGMREFTATQGTENINVVDAMMTPSWSYVTDEYMKEDEEGYNFPPFESMTALVYADANGTVLYPIEFVAKKVEEPARVWDFTKWSEETVNNLAAEAAQYSPATEGVTTLWRSYEKDKADKNGNYNPNETNGAAYWYGTEIAEAQSLKANGKEIAETAGLLFDKVSAGALAIAVNYPSTSLGTYAGPAYLWIGGKNNSFTIPAVKPGSAIEITIESHKPAEGRGVKLSVGGEVIGEAIPKTVETFTINVPASDAETVDVKVENTNGCHIYTIKIDENPATAVENIAALKALADGTDATLAVNGAKVTFVSGTDAYIEDETGALLIEGEGLNLTAGKAITGTINGKLTIVKEKLHKFVATEANVTEADAQIAATVLTIAEANKPENISKLVKLENVDANIDYQQIVDSNDEYIMFLDKYNVLGGENPKKVESIVGVLGFMGTNTNMFYPVSKDSIVAAPVVPAKEVKTIAEMKAVEDGTEVNFVMNNVKVTSISAGRMSSFGTIEDETGAIQLGSDMISSIFMEQGISEGMAVSGHVTGTYSVVDGIPTFDISENTGVADELTGTEATITPSEATIAGVKNAESISKYVILKDVKVTGVEEGFAVAFTAAQGEETIAVEDVMIDPLTREGVLSKYVKYGEDGSTTISLPEMFESMTAIVSIDWHGTYVLYPKAVVEKEAQEEIAVVWDFTKWSEETVNNLKADAATVEPDADGKYPAVTPWRSYEKVGGPTEADPDRGGAAFWYGTAITEAQSLKANGTEIAETAGLLFDNVAAGALAIAVDYPSTTLGTYAGPSYLWIGGKNNTFTIPAVKPGSTIEIKIESHKAGDARGVKLSVGGEVIGEAIPTSAETFRIVVPASDAKTVDVKVENTNGCHIYTIGINDYEKINTGISSIKSDVKAVSGVYTINGVKVRNAGESLDGLAKGLYIIDGKKVVIK